MKILEKKITYQEFREMDFDDSDALWYKLINGEPRKKKAMTSTTNSFLEKLNSYLLP